MCCAVNVENNMRESDYTDLVQTMQNSSRYSLNKSGNKHKIAGAVGIKNGLRLVLDLHSNFESFGSIETDFRAFRIFIGQPTEFAALQERSLIIEPGREHFIDLTSQVFSSSGIKHIHPKDRNCNFKSEGSLEFFKEYTYTNCRLECGIKATEKEVGCIPWYLPHDPSNSTTCDPWKTILFRKLLTRKGSNSSLCSHCLADCELVETSVTASSGILRYFLAKYFSELVSDTDISGHVTPTL